MILTLILNLIYYLIKLLLSPLLLFSDVTLPANVSATITSANNYLAGMAQIAPIYTIISVIALIVGMEVAIFGYKFIMWVIRKIPTIN